MTSCDSGGSQRTGVYYEQEIPTTPYPSGGSNVSFQGQRTSLVQTTAGCDECGCTGYKGIKHHSNGTYEGACIHSDGYGHTCGHGPEKHGLKKW